MMEQYIRAENRFKKISSEFETEQARKDENSKEHKEKVAQAVEKNIQSGDALYKQTLDQLTALGHVIDVSEYTAEAERAYQEHKAKQYLLAYEHLNMLEALQRPFMPPDRAFEALPEQDRFLFCEFALTLDEDWLYNGDIIKGAVLEFITKRSPLSSELTDFFKKYYGEYMRSPVKNEALFSREQMTDKQKEAYLKKLSGKTASKQSFLQRLTSAFKRPPSQPSL